MLLRSRRPAVWIDCYQLLWHWQEIVNSWRRCYYYAILLISMGALCSKGIGISSRRRSSSLARDLNARQRSREQVVSYVADSGELRMESSDLEEADSLEKMKLGYKLAQERTLESTNSFERMKLSRVLSSKAKSARTKTTTVAKKGAAKVSEVGLLLGRAGTASLGKAVEALDTVGSSLTTIGSGFGGGVAPKGSKIGILAFEVANTIVRGFSLMHSLSDEDVKVLKEEILPSEGVQRLISRDMDELWRIAAADKRNDLKVFTREVVRFGNHCRDPRWHQLCRIFDKLGSEVTIPRQSKEIAEAEMEHLMIMAQQTAELYHELHALDRFHNDLKRKLQQEEEMYSNSQRGESIAMLKGDLKAQQKHVKSLKKRSLWSKILEEVMEKLVDVVYFLHQRIHDVFGPADEDAKVYVKEGICRLGPSGLALHYANIINQIDNLVSRPNSVPPNTRDTLYQGLPPSIKAALRSRLQMPRKNEEMTIPQIKAEMEKILDWLAPVALNTTRAHHGFGWVGEWANSGSVLDRRLPGHTELIRLQTLHHAEQSTAEFYILELIVWLNVLVSCARNSINGHRSPFKSPNRSPATKKSDEEASKAAEEANAVESASRKCGLSQEDQEMLKDVVQAKRRMPGISKSQEFDATSSKPKLSKRLSLSNRLSKSNSHSPSAAPTAQSSSPRHAKRHHQSAAPPPLDLDIDRINEIDTSSSKRSGS
ncbi:uncharacterized protein LOC9655198 [Selaginella moellendorffii]|nr:uncharacterized protein LOC9655198 [Selaginella moellendorffii]|eukprot:XP_002963258.2 uncharacterized protein LOC9655198 [Selaginella moellendorffii]